MEERAEVHGAKDGKGKAALRHNALKHGALAKEVILPAGDGKEDEGAFEALLRGRKRVEMPIGFD